MMWPRLFTLSRLTLSCQSKSLAIASGVSNRRFASSAGSIILESPAPSVPQPEVNYAKFALSRADQLSSKPALVFAPDSSTVSYAELKERVAKAASALIRSGFGPGQVLGMVLHNCPEFVVAQLAAIAIGGAVTLINPMFTPRELAYHLKLTGATMAVVGAARLSQLIQAAGDDNLPDLRTVFVVDGEGAGGGSGRILSFNRLTTDSGAAFQSFDVPCDAHSVAAIPFSSGTTGLPKGVALSHASLNCNPLQLAATAGFPELTEVSLGLLPCFHISGFTIVSMSLALGYTTVLLPQFDPELMLNSIERHRITQMALVPPLVLFLLQHSLTERANLSSVRLVLSAAAPLGADVQRRLRDRLAQRWNPTVDVIQAYGGTEMSPLTHVVPPLERRPAGSDHMGSVGVPVSLQRTRLVSTVTGEDLGPNQSGEIVVTGPHRMLGYYKNEHATLESVKDGWYHTGDVGWYDKYGQFFITDRLKEFIKVKAFQVAPAELEALLLACPGVADAGVIGVPHDRLGEAPRAYIVRRSDSDPKLTERQVADFVAKNAADYKRLEGGVRFVSAIPRNPSGKILRRVLRESD